MDDLNTRKALAAAVDRQRIIDEVLAGGGEPLYSMVPTTFDAYVPAFEDLYGQADPEDFVDGTVNLDLWFASRHELRFAAGDPGRLERLLQRLRQERAARVFSAVTAVERDGDAVLVRFGEGPEPALQPVETGPDDDEAHVACHLHGVVPRHRD